MKKNRKGTLEDHYLVVAPYLRELTRPIRYGDIAEQALGESRETHSRLVGQLVALHKKRNPDFDDSLVVNSRTNRPGRKVAE